jgi:hypothetical protein
MPVDENKEYKSDLKWCRGVRFTGESRQENKKDDTDPRRYQRCIRFAGESGEDNWKDEIVPKWHQDRLRFTGEYCSGMVSGLGWGITILAYPMHFECVRDFTPLIGVAGGIVGHIGAEFGRRSQRDRREGRVVNAETDKTKWTRHDCIRLWLLGEYFAGIILGIALGIVVLICVPTNLLMGFRWIVAMICGFALIVIGSSVRHDIRQQRAVDSNIED